MRTDRPSGNRSLENRTASRDWKPFSTACASPSATVPLGITTRLRSGVLTGSVSRARAGPVKSPVSAVSRTACIMRPS